MAIITKILEGTVSAGSTTITFTDSDIPYSLVRVYASDPDAFPTEQSISGNVLTIVYPLQTDDLGVAVELVKAPLSVIDALNSSSQTDALSAKQGAALKDMIDAITVPEVVDDLTTQSATDALSANQGYVLNNMIDAITVPEVVDDLTTQSATNALSANQGYVLKGLIDDYTTVQEEEAVIIDGITWCTWYGTGSSKCYRSGNHVSCQLRITITDMPTQSSDVSIITLPWTLKGLSKFGQLNKSLQPYAMQTTGIFIVSNSKNVRLRTTLTNGSYFLSFDYITSDPI